MLETVGHFTYNTLIKCGLPFVEEDVHALRIESIEET